MMPHLVIEGVFLKFDFKKVLTTFMRQWRMPKFAEKDTFSQYFNPT
jgi:hypothetical protein